MGRVVWLICFFTHACFDNADAKHLELNREVDKPKSIAIPKRLEVKAASGKKGIIFHKFSVRNSGASSGDVGKLRVFLVFITRDAYLRYYSIAIVVIVLSSLSSEVIKVHKRRVELSVKNKKRECKV